VEVPVEALVDYLHLWAVVDGVQLSDQLDKTVWRWTADGTYTPKSAYNMLHTGSIALPGHKLIWKTWTPMRIKIILCLVFKRGHWMWGRRTRHSLEARSYATFATKARKRLIIS
jgi:hypothetical protein